MLRLSLRLSSKVPIFIDRQAGRCAKRDADVVPHGGNKSKFLMCLFYVQVFVVGDEIILIICKYMISEVVILNYHPLMNSG